jgi:ATP-binding cassette, subfamily B, bacterial
MPSQTRVDADPRDPSAAARRLTKLLAYYRPHIPLLLADLACAILVAATALALPISASYITRQLNDLNDVSAVLNQIGLAGGIMLALLALQALCTIFVDYQGHMMGAKMERAMRTHLFEHLQKLSFSFYDRQRVGQLMSRMTNDLFDIGELCHHGPEDIAISVLKFAGAVALLSFIDLPLTLIILSIFPVAILYAVYFNERMRQALRLGKQQIAAINEQVEDSLSGIRVVKSFANEPIETRRFEHENARFLDIKAFGYRSEAWFSVGMSTIAQLITVGVIVAGAIRVVQADLKVGDLLTFLLCVAILVDPITRTVNFVRLWQMGYTGFNRFMDILETEPDIQDHPGAAPLNRVAGAISFRDVSFRYAEDGPKVLDGASLEIKAGEFVALVGASGIGKSTLCSLIPRFYEVTEGAILIDGVDIRDVSLTSLRRNIGVVQQDVYLFAGSVAENLRYGRPDATQADIEQAARRANAHDFIMALPQGYDTDVGQRGVRLSGGQKQRLTIARAFLKDPPILIFDEATSALDNELELAKARTTLVIAHRLSTVRHADRILVLTDQGIAEQGRHDELIAAGGVYAGLYSVQASL